MPDAVQECIERHAVTIAEHRDALLAASQHLKRGLLLYRPATVDVFGVRLDGCELPGRCGRAGQLLQPGTGCAGVPAARRREAEIAGFEAEQASASG